MENLFYSKYKSPVGEIFFIYTILGLSKIQFTKPEGVLFKPQTPLAIKIKKQLREYFSKSRKKFSLKIDITGTDFQIQVWKELVKIPYGETVSYKDLSHAINHPYACRAIGNANGQNPLPIIIPCHRVIQKNGELGGYSLGLPKKKFLLKLEGYLK